MPLRDGHSGKTRLADHFTQQERGQVVTALVRHVVRTLHAVDLSGVLVVTHAPEFVRRVLPPHSRLQVVAQPAERPGLNAGVTLGREVAAEQGVDRLLIVHADLPLLALADVEALLSRRGDLVLAPDRAGTGTNALVLDAASRDFRFRFGPGSRLAHLREAAALGLRSAVVERSGTWTDLDTAADWAALPDAVRARLQPSARRGVGVSKASGPAALGRY